MNDHTEELIALALILSLMTLFPGPACAESLVTISGVISEEGQLFADDGAIYEIAENETGLELMEMAGCQVAVTGHTMKTEETDILMVIEFEVVRK